VNEETIRTMQGRQVKFGSPNGIKTLGTIVKINISKCKIRQDEDRNSRPIGTIWNVPFNLIYPADGNEVVIQQPVKKDLTDWWILDHEHEIHILMSIYNGLSPECLSCDGEASMSHVRTQRAKLERKLRAVFVLLDLTLDEGETYDCFDRLNKLKEAKTQTQEVKNG